MVDIKRMEHIRLVLNGDNTYTVLNKNNIELLSSEEDYFIYMGKVKFLKGKIEGKYLGELEKDSPLLSTRVKDVVIDNGKFYTNNEQIRRARLVAVNNKSRTIVIISE